jgi:arylsulfatase
MDNLGWGELGVYGGGILRGAPTPRVDKLAAEGTRLLNFNVEAQCTPSRAALLTGRYAIRSGNGSVPMESPVYGLRRWEYTMAEMLSDAGYATAMYGKWHLGQTKGRFPTDHGFDEWYGIPNSSNDAYWADNPRFRPNAHPFIKLTHVMASRRGEDPKETKVFDLKARTMMDREITERAIEFLRRQAPTRKPFFLSCPTRSRTCRLRRSPSSKGRPATAISPMCWRRSTPTPAGYWMKSPGWEFGTTQCSFSPPTMAARRPCRITASLGPGEALTSPDLKARFALRSCCAGRVKCQPGE